MAKCKEQTLLTGASGALGRQLAVAMAAEGYPLRLTDINPLPVEIPIGATFTQADLGNGQEMKRLAGGCGTIIHFGGIAREQPFEDVIEPNIRGVYHIYEAARCAGARVVLASSNHAFGFYERTQTLSSDCHFRADGFYGLSKAYGEMMARLYWDKHGIETVCLRIGSCHPKPTDARMLATWLSYDDLNRLVIASVRAERVGLASVWGVSNNRRAWWQGDSRNLIGWEPLDSADRWISELEQAVEEQSAAETYQGGSYCALGYSRSN
jgi:uronate dehydrogenase